MYTSQHTPHFQRNTSNTATPPRRIKNNPHQAPRHQPSTGQRDEPPHIDPRHHTPVNRPPRPITQPHTDRRTGDALRRRHGKGELGRHDDSNGSTELHREPTRRRVQRDLVAQRAHDVVAVGPEADDDAGAAEGEDPEGDGDFGGDFCAAGVSVMFYTWFEGWETYVDHMK
jgi:hypothetical protein